MINKKNLKNSNINPLVTIITVVKNNQSHLEKTIRSVISQKYQNIEYIIIDSNSTDNTKEIINKYKDRIHKYIREKDKNIWDAYNKAIRISTGSIIAFLNSDDYFNKKAVSCAVKYLKNRDVDFVFGSVFKHWLKTGYNPIKAYWSFGFYTTHSVGFFAKKKVYQQVGLYDDRFLSADLDLYLRIIFSKKFKGIGTTKNEVFGFFRPGGYSSKVKYREHQIDLNRIRINNKQNKLFVYGIYLFKIIKNFRKFLLNKH